MGIGRIVHRHIGLEGHRGGISGNGRTAVDNGTAQGFDRYGTCLTIDLVALFSDHRTDIVCCVWVKPGNRCTG